MEYRTMLIASVICLMAIEVSGQYPDYGVVVDAGSSGSRARVYRLAPGPRISLVPSIIETYAYKKQPGVSTFAENLDNLRDYIDQLLRKVKESGAIPETMFRHTPIYFMATAGMRLLLEDKANDVMAKVDTILRDSTINPFKYRPQNTRILSGEEEGAFAWITVNYLNGFFTLGSVESVGVLELGGASTQIVFIPRGSPLAHKFPIEIGGKEYPLYVHSYLYYGQEYAMRWSREHLARTYPGRTSIENPCMLHDDNMKATIDGVEIEFDGTGDPIECLKIVDEYVYKAKPFQCHPKPCAIGNVYQPSVVETKEFYAIGAFLYPIRAFNILQDDNTVLPDDILRGAMKYCRMDFAEAKNISKEKDDYVSANCLMGLYTAQLFTKAYGFKGETTQIKLMDDIKKSPINWAMGALLYETSKENDPLCTHTGAVTGSASHLIFPYHYLYLIIFICLQFMYSTQLAISLD